MRAKLPLLFAVLVLLIPSSPSAAQDAGSKAMTLATFRPPLKEPAGARSGMIDLVVSPTGALYATGHTGGKPPGDGDAYGTTYVAELDPSTGATLWQTVIDGYGNRPQAIALDPQGNIYVTGDNFDEGPFETTPGAYIEDTGCAGFVIKLSPEGDIVYSTMAGVSAPGVCPGAVGEDIAVDSSGSAYVVGDASYQDTCELNNAQIISTGGVALNIGMIVKLSPDGSAAEHVTCVRGGVFRSVAVGPTGTAYVSGIAGLSYPTTPGAFQSEFGGESDAMVSAFSPGGDELLFSSFFGGEGDDFGTQLAVDAGGSPWLIGATDSGSLPLEAPIQDSLQGETDGFIASFDATLSALEYSTYLGGEGSDQLSQLAVGDRITVVGASSGPGLPLLDQIFSRPRNNGQFFVTQLDPGGSLLFSSYLGGRGRLFGPSVGVEPGGSLWVAGHPGTEEMPLVDPLMDGDRKHSAWLARISQSDSGCDLLGDGGANLLIGSREHDVMCGLEGRDVVKGKRGDDELFGGPGDDRLVGGKGTDSCRGGAGDDKLKSCE